MNTPALYQIAPRWSEVLAPFRDRDYPRALELALGFLAGLDDDLPLRGRLDPNHYANIYNNIAESAYHILERQPDDADLATREEWRHFFGSLDAYLTVVEGVARTQPQAGWWQDARFPTTLLRQTLNLLQRDPSTRLAAQAESWAKRFTDVWGPTLVLPVLLEAINAERINVLRQGYLDNTQTLAQLYLRLTASLPPGPYRHPRSLVMDILSDLTYFTGGAAAEDQALAWVEQALAVNPDDQFARQRRKDMMQRKEVMDQIRRFNHDASTAIAGLVSNLRHLECLSLPEPAPRLVEKMRRGVNRIHGVHRFVQEQQAQFIQMPLRREIERLIMAYDEVCFEVTGGEGGETLETDPDYFQIVMETLIRNAVEAFVRKGIEVSERRIVICCDAPMKRISVRDNAGGIDLLLREQIFDPYVSTKAVKQATGLGLSSARNIMERLLEGRLSLTDPQPVGGAEFLVQF